MKNYLNLNKDKIFEVPNYEFINEKIYVDDLEISVQASDPDGVTINVPSSSSEG